MKIRRHKLLVTILAQSVRTPVLVSSNDESSQFYGQKILEYRKLYLEV